MPGCSLRVGLRTSVPQEELGIEQLHIYIERSQLMWEPLGILQVWVSLLKLPSPRQGEMDDGYTRSSGLILFLLRPPCPRTHLTASCIAFRFSTVFSIICRLLIHCCRIHLCCKSISSRSISAYTQITESVSALEVSLKKARSPSMYTGNTSKCWNAKQDETFPQIEREPSRH